MEDSSRRIRGSRRAAAKKSGTLLLAEGLAVGALVHGGVALVGTYQDAVQGAVVAVGAVVSALLNGAFNALVCLTIHSRFLLFGDVLSMIHIFFSIHTLFN